MDPNLRRFLISMTAGEAEEQDIRAISDQLEADPDQCQEYLEHCRLHSDLCFLIGSDAAEQRVLDAIGAEVLTPHGKPASKTKRSSGQRFVGLLALAASLAIVAVVANSLRDPEVRGQVGLRRPTIVATVVSAEEAVWRAEEFAQGTSVRVGTDLQLQTGTVRVNLPSGVELTLQGPCDLSLESPSQIRLRRGRVTARIADWAPELQLKTGPLTVVNLGTHFAVEADNQGNVEAHALEGNIRIQPAMPMDESRKSFVVAEGEAIRASSKQSTTERFATTPDRFAANHGEFRPYRSIPLRNSGIGLAVGDEDPNWRIVDGAIGACFDGPQFAVVCEADERYLPNQPRISQWMSVAKDLRPGCSPNSTYTFRTEFDLTGYDLSTVMILVDMLADNGVKEVRLNGQLVEIEGWRDNELEQTFHHFRRAEINSGFVQGANTIEIDVWNGIYQVDPKKGDAKPTPNPMSLRVEWQAFGVPKLTQAEFNTI